MDIRKADGGTRLFIERSAAFAVCLLLLILRRPSTITRAQFWAEDGTIFYRDALVLGWKSLLQPYAGYSHLCVRIVALLASHLNARHAPLCLNLAALLLAAFCCSEFAHARYRFLLESDILRSVLCLAMAAAFPSYELVGNMANLQWFILVAAIPMALYSEPSGPGSRLILFALGLFIALTVPALLVILPIIYWPSRIRRLSALSIGITAGLFLQLSIFFRGGQNGPTRVGQVAGTVKTTLIALSNQVILPTLIGQRHAYSVATRLGGG